LPSDRLISRDRLPKARECLLLVSSGVLLSLAFPPVDFVPAAFLGLVPFFYVLRRARGAGFRGAFRRGLIAGVAFFGPLLYWLVFLSSQEMDNPVLMSGPLVLLVLLQSLYWGLFSAGAVRLHSSTRVPSWLFLPVLWIACEQLRSLFVLGLTWGALGYAGVTVFPQAVQFASVTGVFGVSLWMVLVNALVLELIVCGRRRRRLATFAAAFIVFAAPWVHGALVLRGFEPGRTVRVAVVQPNIDAALKWDERYKSLSFDTLTELTRLAAAEAPDLVVWPETAAPSYLLREPEDLARVAAAAALGAPILTGCPDIEAGEGPNSGFRALNSALLIGEDGTVAGKYDKIHLVPFGEVIPFETVIPALRRVDFGEADFAPGKERVVFDLPEGMFSVAICFESIFPRLVRQFVEGGAGFLVNVTNDVWYGRTSMPFQHAAMAVMRSIENRRSLARSANSGVSLVTDPHGRVLKSLAIFERGVIVEDLPVVSELTFYARHGDVVPWAACLLSVLLVLAPAAARIRGR
jgi:apolipoprotein N-acyltransferase